MNSADLARNLAQCDRMIASYTARLEGATGEDAKDLKERRAGYEEKRAELAKPVRGAKGKS